MCGARRPGHAVWGHVSVISAKKSYGNNKTPRHTSQPCTAALPRIVQLYNVLRSALRVALHLALPSTHISYGILVMAS